ncbi:MAG: DNA primase [Candidatus Binatia bacterium]
MIAEDKISEIKEAARISDFVSPFVELKRSGRSVKGLCPFHSEKTPSFSVNDENGFYHCFGCGAGGNVFKFLMEVENLTFPEAVRKVAERYGIEVPDEQGKESGAGRRDGLFKTVAAAARYYRRVLLETPAGKPYLEYLEARGISAEARETFLLGAAPASGDGLARWFAKEHLDPRVGHALGLLVGTPSRLTDRFRSRLIFPIRDGQGRVVGLAGRRLGEDGEGPKYLNSPESEIYSKGRLLYGLFEARDALRSADYVVLVEGYTDVIALHQAGLCNVVATCGTALSAEQVRLLKRYSGDVVTLFDGDAAGLQAAARSFRVCLEAGVWARGTALPSGEDPDSFVRAKGIDLLRTLLSEARPLADAYLKALVGDRGSDSTAVARAGAELAALLKKVKDPFEYDLLVRKASMWTEISEKTLRAQGRGESRPGGGTAVRRGGGAAGPEELLVSVMLSSESATARVVESGALGFMGEGPWKEIALDLAANQRKQLSADVAEMLSRLGGGDSARLAARLNDGVFDDPVVRDQTIDDCVMVLERRAQRRQNLERLLRLKKDEELGVDVADRGGLGDWKPSKRSSA